MHHSSIPCPLSACLMTLSSLRIWAVTCHSDTRLPRCRSAVDKRIKIDLAILEADAIKEISNRNWGQRHISYSSSLYF